MAVQSATASSCRNGWSLIVASDRMASSIRNRRPAATVWAIDLPTLRHQRHALIGQLTACAGKPPRRDWPLRFLYVSAPSGSQASGERVFGIVQR